MLTHSGVHGLPMFRAITWLRVVGFEHTSCALMAAARSDHTRKMLLRLLRVGHGDHPETTVGPVATAAQHERLNDLRDSVQAAGAKVVAEGTRAPGLNSDGYWVTPTLLTDVPEDHPAVTREVFGPVLTVVPVDSVDEATSRVNASAHGLVTAVHTSNLGTAQRFARQARCGLVKINERTTGNGVAPPFGGWKESSSGAFPESGRQALDFVTDTKTVYAAY